MNFVSADRKLRELCEFQVVLSLRSAQLIMWRGISFQGAVLTSVDCGKPLECQDSPQTYHGIVNSPRNHNCSSSS